MNACYGISIDSNVIALYDFVDTMGKGQLHDEGMAILKTTGTKASHSARAFPSQKEPANLPSTQCGPTMFSVGP